jgi:plastocyanin
MSRSPKVAGALAVAATAVAALVAALPAGASHAAPVKLTGVVGPGFSISLTQAGKPVKSLKAGTYAITVSDKASFHNFVLEQESGGTLNKEITTVPFTGTKTVTVTLTKGSYKFYCAPHESGMFGEFTVA